MMNIIRIIIVVFAPTSAEL